MEILSLLRQRCHYQEITKKSLMSIDSISKLLPYLDICCSYLK